MKNVIARELNGALDETQANTPKGRNQGRAKGKGALQEEGTLASEFPKRQFFIKQKMYV